MPNDQLRCWGQSGVSTTQADKHLHEHRIREIVREELAVALKQLRPQPKEVQIRTIVEPNIIPLYENQVAIVNYINQVIIPVIQSHLQTHCQLLQNLCDVLDGWGRSSARPTAEN